MKLTTKQKVDIFYFGLVFLVQFFMVFSVVKQMNKPAFRTGLKQSSEVLTKPMR